LGRKILDNRLRSSLENLSFFHFTYKEFYNG
jgi:hypothetical protein